jgi:hypothetical protein
MGGGMGGNPMGMQNQFATQPPGMGAGMGM